jgi:hypothetical protein
MATLKNNIKNISDNTENMARDYLKLFSIKQSEKFALLLGVLTSVFVLATILLVLIVFSSFALAETLNNLMISNFLGFVIVGGVYLLVAVLIIVKIFRTHTPLFANFFAKLIISVLNVDSNQSKSLKGLKREEELIHSRIEADKSKIKADFQSLQYTLMGFILKEILGLFTSKKKDKRNKN